MRVFVYLLMFVLAGAVSAAAPIVHGAMPPLHERPSEGIAIAGPGKIDGSDDTMNVCMIRAQFLEDFTDETSGNGIIDLEADPPHNREYFQGIADNLALYYEDVSGGQLILSIDVYPSSPNGAYTLQHQMMYYGDDSNSMQGACLLLRDAVLLADEDIDFSQYDAVIIVHAGAGQEADILRNSPGDIGSVFLTLTDLIRYLPGAGSDYQGIPTSDGVHIREGVIAPEQESQDGFGLGVLGTICHEFGHQLGLPDLYDTNTGHVGIGGWDLMGYGQWMMSGYWPSSLSAWSRVYLGWNTPSVTSGGTFTLAFNDSILKVPLTGSEYLLIENRQRDPDGDHMCGIHEHDFGLPGSGILIWHIDETRLGEYLAANMVNVDPDHKGVDLEEADGIQDFDYSLPDIYGYEGSEFDPWFRNGYAWEFSPTSEPSSDASWGGNTFVTVEVLDEPALEMDVIVSRTTVCDGWPVQSSTIKWGPLIWENADTSGDRIVVTTTTGHVSAYMSDGSGPEPMGTGITAPPVAGNPSGGSNLLLVCENDGQAHLRDVQWNEPDGWPVKLSGGGSGTAALISERLNIVAIADDEKRVHLYNPAGAQLAGWPAVTQAQVAGMAVYPDENNPGIIASTIDGRVYLWNTDGDEVAGWPVAPGDEKIGIPLSADINRDGSPDIVVVSGDYTYAYDIQGNILPGFPSMLAASPLSSPCLGDPNMDGRLEILILTDEGVAAVGASGATLENWPVMLEQDSLVSGYSRNRRGISGRGFALISMDDGRICLFDYEGRQSGIFPVSVGERPIGRPLLWDPENSGNWRVLAAEKNGCIYCWHTSMIPEGWFTGLDMSGCNCWWNEDLPNLPASSSILHDGSFYVYPNPVQQGNGIIRFQPGENCSWEIRIFNMGGDLVYLKTGTAPGGSAWEVPWNTEDLAPGVYFVSLHISSDTGSTDALFHAAVIN
ncbi:MAG: M6 family metalloprotease domain-containing protein [Candidatus Aegiribacteria sp.]|nr:M6 family metalloprotease domain-containing protein [Candidatus Aegiribacteria sp.]